MLKIIPLLHWNYTLICIFFMGHLKKFLIFILFQNAFVVSWTVKVGFTGELTAWAFFLLPWLCTVDLVRWYTVKYNDDITILTKHQLSYLEMSICLIAIKQPSTISIKEISWQFESSARPYQGSPGGAMLGNAPFFCWSWEYIPLGLCKKTYKLIETGLV